ncbi:MAG: thioether cross-link-forming SCIFF peptide maturase [Lachnospiraceae bacterium]|nr:thioether cross-link-forming SCIFF peptide maturase [Lachnospiraceae bacterium]
MVHQYKNNGFNIVMDVESGSVHVVDDIVYDLVRVLDEYSKTNSIRTVIDEDNIEAVAYEEIRSYLKEKLASYDEELIREAYEETAYLIEDERLFTDDLFEDNIAGIIGREPVLKALCLHVAHDCNLACRYCFAGEGEYHGDRQLMSFEVGKKALDLLVRSSKNRRNLEVDFFGGEPLMNFEVVKQLVEYGRSLEDKYDKKFRFTLTTNGVLLDDEILDFANKEMGNLVLSLDGRPEVHDRMRPRRGGQGSYDQIVPKFIKAAKSRDQMNYYVRGTYTRYNTDFAEDVKHIAELGFEQISVEPVVAPLSEDYSLRDEDIPKLCEQYDILAKYMLKRKKEGKGFNFFHFMIDLSGGPCAYKRISGCGSGTEYLAVAPNGDLYPCHQFVGMSDFLMGNVDTGVENTELSGKFRRCNVYSRQECRNCFAKYYCSGGCAANAYNYSGDINGVYDIGCKLQQKRVETAIMIKAACAE